MVWSRNARAVGNLGIASVLTMFLGACGSMSLPSLSSSPSVAPEPGVAPEVPATIRPDEIVGRWGLASFQNPNDRARTEAAARAQCKQPYVIGPGSSGGVIMHLADQATPQELRLKGSPSGKNYIGPPGPAGSEQDVASRIVRSFPSTDASWSPVSSTRMPGPVTATWSTFAARPAPDQRPLRSPGAAIQRLEEIHLQSNNASMSSCDA